MRSISSALPRARPRHSLPHCPSFCGPPPLRGKPTFGGPPIESSARSRAASRSKYSDTKNAAAPPTPRGLEAERMLSAAEERRGDDAIGLPCVWRRSSTNRAPPQSPQDWRSRPSRERPARLAAFDHLLSCAAIRDLRGVLRQGRLQRLGQRRDTFADKCSNHGPRDLDDRRCARNQTNGRQQVLHGA